MIKLHYYLFILISCTLFSCNNKPTSTIDRSQAPDLPPVTLPLPQKPELPPTTSAPETPSSSPQPIKVAAATVAEPDAATTEGTIGTTETLEELLQRIPDKRAPVATLSNDPIVAQWKQIVFDKFQQDRTQSSFIFEWYVELLLSDLSKTLKSESYWSNPSETHIDEIFTQLIKQHSQKQKEWQKSGIYRTTIQGQKVDFLTSFEVSVSNPPPDRVAIFHTQELLPFFTQAGDPKNIESRAEELSAWINQTHKYEIPTQKLLPFFTQAGDPKNIESRAEKLSAWMNQTHKYEIPTQELLPFFTQDGVPKNIEFRAKKLSAWMNQIHKHEIPVHIFGKCDYICSSYLASAAKKIHIEPFGEILFNGNIPTTYYIANSLSELIKRDDELYLKDILLNNQSVIAHFMQQRFQGDTWEQFIDQLNKSGLHHNAFLVKKIRSTVVKPTEEPIDIKAAAKEAISLVSSMSLRDMKTMLNFVKTEGINPIHEIEAENLVALSDTNNDDEESQIGMISVTTIETILSRDNILLDIEKQLEGLSLFAENVTVPNNDYSFRLNRFAHTAGLLTSAEFLKKLSPSPFSIEKPPNYDYVSPQTAFLIELGFNVELANNNSGIRKYVLRYQDEEEEPIRILPVTAFTLNDCNDFSGGFYITAPQLLACMNY